MAAVTPTSIKTVSLGSADLKIATFSSINNGDTWDSGLSSIIHSWFDISSTPTVSGSNIAMTNSLDVFTFNSDKAGLAGKLNVLTGLQV